MTDVLTRVWPANDEAGAPTPAIQSPATLAGTVAGELAIAVAPTTGRFRPAVSEGWVRAGQLLGHITGGRDRADEVCSPVDADLRALLVRAGQLVHRGQALAWLQRMGDIPA